MVSRSDMLKRITPIWAAVIIGLAGCSGAGFAPGNTPDLVVAASVSDNGPAARATFALSAAVRNAGSAAAPATTLRYFRSTDATISTSDAEVGTDAVSGLAASGTSDESVILTAPSTPGTYYYGACVDAVTGESDKANNCSSAVRITVPEPQSGPNLVVAASVSDSGPVAGAPFTLSAAVRNAGSESSAATTLRFYRSTDATITTSDTELGTDPVVGLAASGSSSQSFDVSAPSTPGTYYYGACVDAVTGESDTTNNCSSSVQVTVAQVTVTAPDLVVAAPSVTESTPDAGAAFTLSAEVRNDGDESATTTTLRYYRSTDATITTADSEVGTDAVAQLAASGTSSESVSLTAPATPGTYYYGACVDAVADESDTTNNCSSSVQVTVSEPDLVVAAPTVSDSVLAPGATFTLSVSVESDGDGSAATTTLNIYRSTDATITTSDTLVGTVVAELATSKTSSQSTRLAAAASPGTYYVGEVELTAPDTPGAYYYGACVDTMMGGADTTDNCSPSARVVVTEPDLVVVTTSENDSSPTAGATFTLSATVRNDGDGASAATTLRYYQSTDTTITTSDTEVGTGQVEALAASGSSRQSVSLTAPATAGTYYYGACVDAVTDESDTTNNCSRSVRVEVGGPPPDLVVVGPNVSEISEDRTFWLIATVHNQGAGGAATTTVRYYSSTDASITTSDTEVGTDSVNTLVPSGNYGATIKLTAPAADGTYYYGACVDTVPRESDTTNNCSVSVRVEVGGPPPDLVVLAPSVSAINETYPLDGTFSLVVTVRNQGGGTAAATTVRYYRSTDGTITTSDTELHTGPVNRLSPSGTSEATVVLTAPETSGTYYYGACVDEVPRESDTTNNCSTSVEVTVPVSEPQMQARPDLEVGTPTVDVASPEAGATITLSATVSNTGDGASEATTLRFYRSTDAAITTTHTEVGTDDVGALAASGTNEGSISVTVPRSMGRYFYGACVDAVADESDTTNNCSAPVTVTVVAPQQPEGAPSVRIYSASSAVTEGMPVRFGVTATPAPTADLDVYLSYVEYARSGDQTTYYIWPPAEPRVTITAGSSSTTLTVSSIDDSDADGNSVLYAWVASGSGYTIDSNPYRRTAFVVVVDDDGPVGDSVLSITAVSTSVSEGTAVQFTVSANPAPTVAVTVGYRVSETGSTFAEALDPGWNPGTVTIGAGQSTATLRFDTVDDSTDEEDSEVEVTLRVDTYPDGVELGFPAEAYVTVLDDD